MAAAIGFYRRLDFQPGFVKSDLQGAPVLRQMRIEAFFIELIVAVPPGTQGVGHIGLKVDDADRAHARLAEAGLSPEPPRTGVSGVRFFFITDPDGNRIEITS